MNSRFFFHSFRALVRMMVFFLIPPPTVLKKNLEKILSSSFSSQCRLIHIYPAKQSKSRKKQNKTRKLHLQANVSKKVIILHSLSYRLEALREHRPPWLRQIITRIFPNVIMLSHGGERLTPKVLNHYLHHDLGMQQLLPCFYAHLLILEYPDHHQNLISSSLCYPGTLSKISSQSIHNFLSNVVHSQRDRQTNQSYQKHNLLCQGGKNCNVFILYSNYQILQHASHNCRIKRGLVRCLILIL